MATQQSILFAETIAGMKKAFKRKSYESDSDSEIESYGNRGYKLKRRARFARRGQLVPTEGPSAYKETVDYAGTRRSIINRNPALVDEFGYEIDSDDDDERIEEALASAADLNPYANIRLEHILAPLTASTDLPSHPTLSKPFTSKNLTDLALQSSMMMRNENQSLWQVRHLWTALCGDHTWASCEVMLGPNDSELYTDDHVAQHLLSLSRASNTAPAATINGEARVGSRNASPGPQNQPNDEDGDVTMTTDADQDADSTAKIESNKQNGNNTGRKALPDHKGGSTLVNGKLSPGASKVESKTPDRDAKTAQQANGNSTSIVEPGNPILSAHLEAVNSSFIHPIFLPPPGALPDQNCGLPDQEAEDIRRLLALFVQKQEEVCRGVNRLHDGLAKAHRLRKDVLHWSKAEAHSGANKDMSDGEDWYDMEEWGLEEELKKGHDDEEEDTTTTGKKTRARR